MSSKVISVTSSQHFRKITSSSTYTIVDFYADWCGPCKVISPVFEQLAAAESKPGRIVFAKVNVDDRQDVASIYGISAMPTFLILKGSSVKETVRGANPTALRTAVLSAAADAGRGPGQASALFSGKGQTLGSGSTGGGARTNISAPGLDFGSLITNPAAFAQGQGILHRLVRFIGLYLTTLFSFEPSQTAAQSPFAVRGNTRQKAR